MHQLINAFATVHVTIRLPPRSHASIILQSKEATYGMYLNIEALFRRKQRQVGMATRRDMQTIAMSHRLNRPTKGM
jgi:hypothetical protein